MERLIGMSDALQACDVADLVAFGWAFLSRMQSTVCALEVGCVDGIGGLPEGRHSAAMLGGLCEALVVR